MKTRMTRETAAITVSGPLPRDDGSANPRARRRKYAARRKSKNSSILRSWLAVLAVWRERVSVSDHQKQGIFAILAGLSGL
jgi:hypothetical protein